MGLIELLEKTFDYFDSIDRIIVVTAHGINYFSALSMMNEKKEQVNVEYYSGVPAHEQEYRLAKVITETNPKLKALEPNSVKGELKAYTTPLSSTPP